MYISTCTNKTSPFLRKSRDQRLKAKQDEAGAVVPDAIVNRRQKKKEKTFEYEAGALRWDPAGKRSSDQTWSCRRRSTNKKQDSTNENDDF